MNKIPNKAGYDLPCALSYLDKKPYTETLIQNGVSENPLLSEITYTTGLLFEGVLHSLYPLIKEELANSLDSKRNEKCAKFDGSARCYTALFGDGRCIAVLDTGVTGLLVIDPEIGQPFMAKSWSELADQYSPIYSISLLVEIQDVLGKISCVPKRYSAAQYAHILHGLTLPRAAPK